MNQENLTTLIIAEEKAALEEWNRGNPTGYLDIYAEDITYFDPFLKKRLAGFEEMKTLYEGVRGAIHVESYEMIDPVVQIDGRMAVLSYNLVSHSGNDTMRWNCTEVYRQQPDEQWKIIHNHWSLTEPIAYNNIPPA